MGGQATVSGAGDSVYNSPQQSNTYYYAPLTQNVRTTMLSAPNRRPSSAWSSRPGRPSGASQPKKHCNCKNSRCLKLYCECFASGRYCDGCNCVNCCNNKESESTRKAAVEAILERNPNAFRPKIQGGTTEDGLAASASARHNKGCNCKKSGCLKKYCECFQAGIFCSDNCKCLDCKNFEGSEAREAVMISQQQDTARPPPASPAPPKRGRTVAPVPPKQPLPLPAPLHKSPIPVYPASPQQPSLVPQTVLQAPAGLVDPAGGPTLLKHDVHLAAPRPAALPARHAVREVVNDMVKQGAVDKLCHLLLVACQEKGAEVKTEKKDEEMLDADQAESNSAVDTDAMEGDRQDSGSPSTSGSHISKVYEEQEKAVLQEFDVFLQKLNTRVQNVVGKHVPTGSQEQLSDGQNPGVLQLAPFPVANQQQVQFVMPGGGNQLLQIAPGTAISGHALQQLLSGMAVIQGPGGGNLQLATLQLQPAGVGASQSSGAANGPVTVVIANPQDMQAGRPLQIVSGGVQPSSSGVLPGPSSGALPSIPMSSAQLEADQ